MINLYGSHLEELFVGKVGNKSRNEGLFISEKALTVTDELRPLLKDFFLKPFRENEEVYYEFVDQQDLFECVNEAFQAQESLHYVYSKIVKHLYVQSGHPHIKSGEVYVAYFNNVIIDNNKVDAIGIFKSEIKFDFLQIREKESILEADLRQGTNLKKLDKGCLIFNVGEEQGYKILSHDSNRYDTKYWLNYFLGVEIARDEQYFTKRFLSLCADFAKDVVLPFEGKSEEVLFINQAMHYFGSNDVFSENDFELGMENPDFIPEFRHYKAEKYPDLEGVSQFPIANNAITAARKKHKPIIKLDTNVTIAMDFINPETAKKTIEKGWDEDKQMYYYLVYFNKEENN